MQARELGIAGAVEFLPPTFPDHRGRFTAPFQDAAFRANLGHGLHLAQVNHSVSRRGALRGVHFTDVPPGQAKYVYCARGAVIDVVVDLRDGSPMFGRWEAVRLDDRDCHGLYVAEGLGHAFLALGDEHGAESVVCYLCSAGYNPAAEHGVDPFDADLAIPWRGWLSDSEMLVSDKDRAAPSVARAASAGSFPRHGDCLARYAQLRADAGD